MRFALAIVHTRKFSGEYVDGLMGLIRPKDGLQLIRVPDLPVDEGRQVAAETFMKTGCEWLLSVDDDMGLHPATLGRLASREVDVVAGMCSTRTYPPVVGVYRRSELLEDGREAMTMARLDTIRWLLKHPEALTRKPAVLNPSPPDALVETRVCGTGCLLVRRRVFEALEPPWFQCTERNLGEDFEFTARARKAGFQPYVDRSVIVGHEWGSAYAMPRDWVVTLLGEAMLTGFPQLLVGLGLFGTGEKVEVEGQTRKRGKGRKKR